MKKLPLNENDIHKRVEELASQIGEDYKGLAAETVFLPVMTGAFFFAHDLLDHLPDFMYNARIESIAVHSYVGQQRLTSNEISGVPDVKGKRVLVVDDIVDTGSTLIEVGRELHIAGAKQIKFASLLQKESSRFNVDYLGFTIDDVFVVGYGMDLDGRYRGIPEIMDVETAERLFGNEENDHS